MLRLFVTTSLRRQRSQWAPIFAVAFLLSAVVVTFGLVEGSSRRALDNGAVQENGGLTYSLNPVGEDSAAISDALSMHPAFFGTTVASGAVENGDGRLVETRVIAVDDPAPTFGRFIAGSKPGSIGEVALTKTVSDFIGADVGDSVHVSEESGSEAPFRDAVVSGIYVFDHRADEREVVTVQAQGAPHPSTQFFTNDEDLSFSAAVVDAYEANEIIRRDAAFRALFLEDDFTAQYGATLRNVRRGAGFVLLLVALAAAQLLRRRFQPTREILVNLGLSGRRAAGLALASAVPVVVAGTLVGAVIARVMFRPVFGGVSELFGQSWGTITINWLDTMVMVTLVWGAVLIVAPLLDRSMAERRSLAVTSQRRVALELVGLAMGVVLFFSVVDIGLAGVLVGAFLILGTGIALIAVAVGHHSSATASLARARRAVASSAVASSIAVAAVIFVSVLTNQVILSALAEERHAATAPGVTPGNYQVESIGTDSADTIEAAYQNFGGVTVRIPRYEDDPDRIVRAISARNLECIREMDSPTLNQLFSCPDAHVSDVGLSINGRTTAGSAFASEALRGDSDEIGVVVANPITGEIATIERIAAEVDPHLGQQNQEAVISPADLPVAALSTGPESLVLLGFSFQPPQVQSRVMGVLYPLTRGLVVNVDPGFQDAGRTSAAMLALVVGGVVAAILAVNSARAVVWANGDIVEAFDRLGMAFSKRQRFFGYALLPLAVSGLFGSLLAIGVRRSLFPSVAIESSSWVMLLFVPPLGVAWLIGRKRSQ